MNSKRFSPIVIATTLILLAGCTQSSEEAFKSFSKPLRAAETVEFLTIDPRVVAGADTGDTVHGHQIRGSVTLSRERFSVILDDLEAMVITEESKYATGCFNPGYALREPASGGAVILICLECSKIQFSRDGRPKGASLDRSRAPKLESLLAELVKELEIRTF